MAVSLFNVLPPLKPGIEFERVRLRKRTRAAGDGVAAAGNGHKRRFQRRWFGEGHLRHFADLPRAEICVKKG